MRKSTPTTIVLAALLCLALIASTAQASVEVFSTAHGSNVIIVPRAPKHHPGLQRQINLDYIGLAHAAREMCGYGDYDFAPADFTYIPDSDGHFIVSQRLVANFALARNLLMNRTGGYNLGYPPSIEDFSNVGYLLIPTHNGVGMEIQEFVGCEFQV
jgi:hypothetical protein